MALDPTPDPSSAARALAARRARGRFTCAICGTEFEALVRDREGDLRTCSGRCRSTLKYRRRRERERQAAELAAAAGQPAPPKPKRGRPPKQPR